MNAVDAIFLPVFYLFEVEWKSYAVFLTSTCFLNVHLLFTSCRLNCELLCHRHIYNNRKKHSRMMLSKINAGVIAAMVGLTTAQESGWLPNQVNATMCQWIEPRGALLYMTLYTVC